MKKVFAVVVVLLFVASFVYADNSSRIKVLTDEINKLAETRQQYAKAIQDIEIQMIAKNGAIEELKAQDSQNSQGAKDVK